MRQKSVMAWSRQQNNENTKDRHYRFLAHNYQLRNVKIVGGIVNPYKLVCETAKTKIGESENGGILLFCVCYVVGEKFA